MKLAKKGWLSFLVFVSLITLVGCGGSGSEGSSEGETPETVTTEDAQNAAAAAVTAVMAVLNAVSADISVMPNGAGAKSTPSKSMEITATEASSCDGVDLSVSGTGSSVTIYGADIASGGSGSCTFRSQGFELGDITGAGGYLTCSDFNGAEATQYVSLDGNLGVIVEVSSAGDTDITARVGTTYLLMGFIQDGATKLCELAIDLWDRITYVDLGSSVIVTSTLTGCVSVCGSPFDVNGSESLTLEIPSS